MSFFITDAMAEGGGDPMGSFMGFIPLIVIFAIFYFLIIRPQVKRAKEHKNLIESVSKGDEVVTGGGMLGKITHVEESIVTIEVANGVNVKVQRNSVASLLPKGTLKSDMLKNKSGVKLSK